jgi:alpha-maltose-1-phosphate synthase
MILVSQPTSNQNTRAALRSLAMVGLLGGFSTTVAFSETVCRLVPEPLAASLKRRSFPEANDIPIYQHPLRELTRVVVSRAPRYVTRLLPSSLADVSNIYETHDTFTASLIPGLRALNGVYACAGGAERTFAVARSYGWKTVLEQPIFYPPSLAELLYREAAANPEWYNPFKVPNLGVAARFEAELSSSDLILAPSNFVKNSLPTNLLKAPVAVVPYGMPSAKGVPRAFDGNRALRVLFVGRLECRKGIKYAVNAVEMLGTAANLSIIGVPPKNVPSRLAAALRRHRHISSLPHHLVLEEMKKHDVLVLPSLAEGMALVVGEALAVGLPVIVTDRCGVDAWVTDGVNGRFVEPKNSDMLAARLNDLIVNPDLVREMSIAALKSVRNWSDYEQAVAREITEVLSDQT